MKYAVLSLLALWVLIYAFALYGFGLDGVLAGLDPNLFKRDRTNFIIDWLFLLGSPMIATGYGLYLLAHRDKSDPG
jgi:hypothetical protein